MLSIAASETIGLASSHSSGSGKRHITVSSLPSASTMTAVVCLAAGGGVCLISSTARTDSLFAGSEDFSSCARSLFFLSLIVGRCSSSSLELSSSSIKDCGAPARAASSSMSFLAIASACLSLRNLSSSAAARRFSAAAAMRAPMNPAAAFATDAIALQITAALGCSARPTFR